MANLPSWHLTVKRATSCRLCTAWYLASGPLEAPQKALRPCVKPRPWWPTTVAKDCAELLPVNDAAILVPRNERGNKQAAADDASNKVGGVVCLWT